MQRNIYRTGIYKLLVMLTCFGLCIPVVSSATEETGTDDNAMEHICIFPSVQPTAESSCTAEAVAYAAAITALNDAQKVANDAYRRWYQCEMSGGGYSGATVEVPPAELSVLVQD